jgi:hypothetical protein
MDGMSYVSYISIKLFTHGSFFKGFNIPGIDDSFIQLFRVQRTNGSLILKIIY